MYIQSLCLASRSRLGSGFHSAPASLTATANILFVCLVCGVICMNTVLNILVTPLPPLSHSHLPLLDCLWFPASSLFHLPPPFSPPSLSQISSSLPLFTHCCQRVLEKNCYIMHFKLSQCVHYGYGEIRWVLWYLIRNKRIKLPICLQINLVNLWCLCFWSDCLLLCMWVHTCRLVEVNPPPSRH